MTHPEFAHAMRAYGQRAELPPPSEELLKRFWEYFHETGLANRVDTAIFRAALDRCYDQRHHFEGWPPPAFVLDQAKLHLFSIDRDIPGLTR